MKQLPFKHVAKPFPRRRGVKSGGEHRSLLDLDAIYLVNLEA